MTQFWKNSRINRLKWLEILHKTELSFLAWFLLFAETRKISTQVRWLFDDKLRPMEDAFIPNREVLLELVSMKMPYGKYKDRLICELPVSYLEWFNRKQFPKGKLGTMLQMMYEIRLNGLEGLLAPLKRK